MSDLVRNPEDRSSHNEAHLKLWTVIYGLTVQIQIRLFLDEHSDRSKLFAFLSALFGRENSLENEIFPGQGKVREFQF